MVINGVRLDLFDQLLTFKWSLIPLITKQNRTLLESAADLGAIILEMDCEEELNGAHSRRLAELKRVRALQERVVHRMLDNSIHKSDQLKRPHLTVLK